MRIKIFGLLAAVAVSLSCSDGSGIIQLEDTAVVVGLAYVDRDGDGQVGPGDGVAAGVLAALVLEATSDTVARATSRPDGTFAMSRIPPGRYRLVASRGAAGDTLEILHLDSARITLAARDSVTRLIRLGYPRTAVSAASALPAGSRITMGGIALNGWATFGDSVIHFSDGTGAMRAVRVPASSAQAGDSISIIGTVGAANGRVVLADARVHVLLAARGLPPADSLSTLGIASADGGRLAEAQARLAGAVVRDTATVGNYRVVGVDDGSGRAEVLLHRAVPFSVQSYTPGATVSFTGVLAPAAGGTSWRLRPRTPDEVTATFPRVNAAQTRSLPIGTRLYVNGIALNGSATFGDQTVHVADQSGAVRAIRVQSSSVSAGDSVQVLGTVGLSDGHRALADADISVIAAARGLPTLDSVATAVARSAADGVRADGHVRIAGAVIVDTATSGGDRVLGVDDGSGRVEVVLSGNISFDPGPFVAGGTLTAAGVLVPSTGNGGWRIKPRGRNEVTVAFPSVSIDHARHSLAPGQQAVLNGLALNALNVFGDSTLHLTDGTGSLRAVRVTGAAAAGDSVRLVGSMGVRDGQPVLTGAIATVLRTGAGLPQADSISTGQARTAAEGTLDAHRIRVAGTIIGAQVLSAGSLLSVDDGSGVVEVLLASQISFTAGPYVAGALIDVTGVLVPTGSGTWRIVPGSRQEVTASYPAAAIADARALPAGKVVQIRAIALNGWADFGDASLHLLDSTGAIRVIGVPASTIFRGDSVVIHGTAESHNGQPVLRGLAVPPGPAPAVVLQGAATITPDSVTTLVASTAQNGARDADQVRVRGTISATAEQGSDLLLTISDGSGDLVVRLQPAQRFPAGSFTVGAKVRVSGVLVPSPTGSWQLKPRTPGEIAKVSDD